MFNVWWTDDCLIFALINCFTKCLKLLSTPMGKLSYNDKQHIQTFREQGVGAEGVSLVASAWEDRIQALCTSVWTAMDRPNSLTAFNEWRMFSHVDACGRLRRQRWSCRWHVVQHWETVRFWSSPPGLGTVYQTTSRQRQPTLHSVQRWRRISVFPDFLHWQHESYWLCNVVLKRCCACTTLIWSYDDDDADDDDNDDDDFNYSLFARKYTYEKLTKCPNFSWHLPEKYFPVFWGRGEVPLSPYPMPMLSPVCAFLFLIFPPIVFDSTPLQSRPAAKLLN